MNRVRHRDVPDDPNRLSERILDAVMEVHRHLGPGFREEHYKQALQIEFGSMGISSQREVPCTVDYKGHALRGPMSMDFVVEGNVIVEAKAVAELHAAHEAQLISYLATTRLPLGLLINFNAPIMTGQIRRFLPPPPTSRRRAVVALEAGPGEDIHPQERRV